MEVIFNFKGEINNQVVKTILKTMEDKLQELGVDRFASKKINSILIEVLQNLIFHSEKPSVANENPLVEVSRNGKEYAIKTINLIVKEKAPILRSYIDKINAMNEEELRNYFQEVLTNGRFNPQGGAGLGFINIARKTKDHKLGYEFHPASNDRMLFQMSIIV